MPNGPTLPGDPFALFEAGSLGNVLRGSNQRGRLLRQSHNAFPTNAGGRLHLPHLRPAQSTQKTEGSLGGHGPIGELIRFHAHGHVGSGGEPVLLHHIAYQNGFAEAVAPSPELELPHSAIYGIEGEIWYTDSYSGGGDVWLYLDNQPWVMLSGFRGAWSEGQIAMEFDANKGQQLSLVVDHPDTGVDHDVEGMVTIATKEPLRELVEELQESYVMSFEGTNIPGSDDYGLAFYDLNFGFVRFLDLADVASHPTGDAAGNNLDYLQPMYGGAWDGDGYWVTFAAPDDNGDHHLVQLDLTTGSVVFDINFSLGANVFVNGVTMVGGSFFVLTENDLTGDSQVWPLSMAGVPGAPFTTKAGPVFAPNEVAGSIGPDTTGGLWVGYGQIGTTTFERWSTAGSLLESLTVDSPAADEANTIGGLHVANGIIYSPTGWFAGPINHGILGVDVVEGDYTTPVDLADAPPPVGDNFPVPSGFTLVAESQVVVDEPPDLPPAGPPPVLPAGYISGQSQNNNGPITSGPPPPATRRFFKSGQLNPGGYADRIVNRDKAYGVTTVWVSIKPPNNAAGWGPTANGNNDTFITQWLDFLARHDDINIVSTFHHEPDNDGGIPENHWRAVQRIASFSRARADQGHVLTVPILTAGSFKHQGSGNSHDPNRFWPAAYPVGHAQCPYDAWGFDWYGAISGFPPGPNREQDFDDAFAFGVSRGSPDQYVGEWAIDTNSAAEINGYLDWFANTKGAKMALYWQAVGDAFDYRLSGAALAALQASY